MKNSFLNHSARLAIGCSVLAVSTGVAAQEADDTFALEEIIVTAQKREQSLRDVPISVSTLRGRHVLDFAAGGEDIRLLSSRIPGLNAESSNGRVAPRFYIRGLGNTDFDLVASQPVSIVMDDVVMENVVLKSFPLFDIERVEVLRGPQGTLFGRNTPAGIIKFDTRRPSQDADGYVSASYGSYGTTTVEAAAGGGLSDTVSARVSGLYQRRGNYIDNVFLGTTDALGGFEEKAGRVQVLLEPSDNLDMLFNFHIRAIDGTSALFRANVFTKGSNDLNENFDRKKVYFSDEHNNPQKYDQWGTSLNLTYDFGDEMTLTSITAFETANGISLGDIDGGNPTGPGFIPFQSTTSGSTDDLDQFTEELRLAVQASDKLFYQVGFFYFNSDMTVSTDPFFIPATPARHKNTTWALFGQAVYDMSDNTALTVGLRYTDDKKSLRAVSGGTGQVFTENLNGSKLSWDVSLNHNVSDDTSVYARIASGFRAPTIQARDIAFFGSPSTAKEETILSFETGFKADLMENRVRWNGAAFYYRVNDLQLSAVGGGGNFIQLVNADKAVGYGFETDVEFLVSEGLIITAGFSYNDTELKDNGLRVGTCGNFGSLICTVLDEIDSNGRAIVDGNPLPQAPKWTLNFTADYSAEVGDGEVFLFTDWAFQGKTNLFLYESVEFTTSGNFEGGLKVGYRWNEGQYEIAGFARNITNEVNVKGGIDFNNLTAYVNEPRVFGVALKANF